MYGIGEVGSQRVARDVGRSTSGEWMFLGEKSASMYMEAGGDGYEVRPRSTEIVVATDVHA